MKRLHSPDGELALSRLSITRALFAFDFDGTLAPIVLRPDQARVATGVFQRLAKLARLAPVAVISGRRLSDLRLRIPPEVRLCVGNHGSERSETQPELEPMRRTCQAWIAQLRERLEASNVEGIFIEDKGVSLSVHFRMARDRPGAERRIAEWLGQLVPEPRVIGGKFVFNVLPPQARDKFEALVEMAAQESVDTVLFVGDDVTDESVFAQAPADWVTVRVERHRDSRAQFYIHDQSDVANLLDRLIEMRTHDDSDRRSFASGRAPSGT